MPYLWSRCRAALLDDGAGGADRSLTRSFVGATCKCGLAHGELALQRATPRSAPWYSEFARRCQVPRPPRLLCAFRKSFEVLQRELSLPPLLRYRRRTTLHPAIFWEMVKFVDLGVLYFSLVLPREPTMGSLRP